MPDSNNYPVWPGWETVRVIGRGSYGAVYEIRRDHYGSTESAAMKVVTIPHSDSEISALRSEGYSDESITARFSSYLQECMQEYSVMANMKGCSNIVYCDDVKEIQHSDGLGWDIFIRMELLTPLSDALQGGITEDLVVKIGSDLCGALAFCEKRNVLHRDIKPQNVFMAQDGTFKLGDFGISKVAESSTRGTYAGTPNYMAPEVFNRKPYGAKADQYSLGLLLYWLLNERRLPFLPLLPDSTTYRDEMAARERRFSGEALPAPVHGSEALKQVVLKACSYNPEDRFHSAREMQEALRKAASTPKIASKVPDAPAPLPQPPRPAPDQTTEFDPGTTERADNAPAPISPRKKKKPVFGVLAVAALFLIVILLKLVFADPSSGTAAPVASGKCGDNCTWALSAKGVLTIEGSGPMEDYVNSNEHPWSADSNIKRVVIKNGVTSIGVRAFSRCSLSSISIPDSVTSIGDWAFSRCSLSNISIPKSVNSIGEYTFYNCASLTDISIPESVTDIGTRAFDGCVSLTSINIPDSVTSIGYGAFDGCTGLTSVAIPDSVTSFGDYAFRGCAGLASITIPDSVTSIGSWTFWGCTGLTSITIPRRAASIGDWTFWDCTGLTSVTIPKSVKTIGRSAFDGCTGLKDVYYTGSKAQWASIRFYQGNDLLIKAAIHYDS